MHTFWCCWPCPCFADLSSPTAPACRFRSFESLPLGATNRHTTGDKSPLHVRREKALDFSGCNSRPGTGSLHPVATETTAEVTKRSELSVKRVARRLRERAGHNVSER